MTAEDATEDWYAALERGDEEAWALLEKRGGGANHVLRSLYDRRLSEGVRARLLMSVRKLGTAVSELVPLLTRDIIAGDEVNVNVVMAIGWMREEARPAIPTLLRALDMEADPESRIAILNTLEVVGWNQDVVVRALAQSIQDEDEEVRDWAEIALRRGGDEVMSILRSLAATAEGDDRRLAEAALQVLRTRRP